MTFCTALMVLFPVVVAGQRGPQGSQPGPIPLDKLLEIHSVVGGETPRWSPAGDRILFSSGLTGGLATLSAEGGFPVRLPVDPGGAGHFLASQEPKWSPDAKWMSFISDKSGHPEIWLFSLADGEEVQLTDLRARINAYSWSPDGRSIALSGDRHGDYDIWTVEVVSGKTNRLTSGSRYEVFPTWSPDGEAILYVRLNEAWTSHEVLEMPAQGGEPRVIVQDQDFFDYQAGGKFGYPRVSPDGERVLFRSHRSGWINYWTVPRAGGEPTQIAPEAADQIHARWSPDGEWIAYTSNHNGTHQLRIVPVAGGDARVVVAPEDMGVVADPEWSPDGERLSYTFETPVRPKNMYVTPIEGGERQQLTRSSTEGKLEDRLISPEKVRYESTDGLTISAYLYAPPGARSGSREHPGILWIHGGPTGQFDDDFQQHVQYFVQRGYVVLLPNIRGSSGYGKAFEDANNRCWGRCDLEDVRAGVDYLKDLGYVDPSSMAITGTSYGGCMSMAAVAFAPGLFQASIPLSGYGDWFHFYEEQELRHIKLLDYELGTPEENPDVYRRVSPIFSISEVATPVFLAHGVGRFPRSEASANFAEALERHYKPFRYKTYPDENYYIYGKQNRAELLEDMLDFLRAYLGG